jgi:hypothetical protein
MRFLFVSLLVLLFGLTASCGGPKTDPDLVTVVKTPPTPRSNQHYVSNRAPLLPSPLVKLPIGAIEPRGWLLGQLRLMRDGLTGRLKELSRFLGPESGWITLKGRGWEEMPYWLKGFGDLAYILKDPAMITEAGRWLDYALASQQPDGFFGPPDNRENLDLWPNMVMLYALQSLHEATGDARVIPFMTKYFRFEASLPDANLLPGSWQKLRGGDNLESVYWLYNRTGDAFLLDLGRRLFERTADWTSPILSPERDKNWVESSFYHGVNIAMGFRQPGVYYQQSKDPAHIAAVERNLRQVLDEYGQQPGGTFGADENIRPGKTDPRQGTETCTLVEFMASFESLLRATGDGAWADRSEEMAFNALPAAMTPDLKGLHYLTAPNLISCDASGEHDFQNSGTLVSYDPWSYRCCQHNVAFGWPYFAEHLWLATPDDGLAAAIYAPSVVQAKVGPGTEVRISEETAYPFGATVELVVETPDDVAFPLYLRLPGWLEEARLSINGKESGAYKDGSSFLRIERLWKNGDRVKLDLAQPIRIKTWPKVGNSVSVGRGPLWYSLRIGERWNRYGGTEAWPAYEILPTTEWNYGLRLDPSRPEISIVVAQEKAPGEQPFTPEAAPVVLKAKVRRVPAWREEGRMAGQVPASPATGAGEVVEAELIPLGCARLRIAQFPVVKE